MIITTSTGREFLVRVVHQGEGYGLEDKVRHAKEDPLIEFYDRAHLEKPAFQPRGQFVARYYASTLAAHQGIGLALQGDSLAWTLDAPALAPVIALARRLHAGLSS